MYVHYFLLKFYKITYQFVKSKKTAPHSNQKSIYSETLPQIHMCSTIGPPYLCKHVNDLNWKSLRGDMLLYFFRSVNTNLVAKRSLYNIYININIYLVIKNIKNTDFSICCKLFRVCRHAWLINQSTISVSAQLYAITICWAE